MQFTWMLFIFVFRFYSSIKNNITHPKIEKNICYKKNDGTADLLFIFCLILKAYLVLKHVSMRKELHYWFKNVR